MVNAGLFQEILGFDNQIILLVKKLLTQVAS
jgi:hypothetical protein